MDFNIKDEKLVVNKDGKDYEYDVLFTFDCEDTMKTYIGYTDGGFASNGRKNIYVSSYSPLSLIGGLEDITDERELAMVNDVLEKIDQESSN